MALQGEILMVPQGEIRIPLHPMGRPEIVSKQPEFDLGDFLERLIALLCFVWVLILFLGPCIF